MKSLLVIKPSSLGDIVHGLQVLQAVARAQPELRISWIVRERFAGLVQAAPFVHETIIFRRRAGWRSFVRLLRDLRRRQFDAVWDMQGLLRTGLMTAAARAPAKWGRPDAREGAGLFYNRRVKLPAGAGPHHAMEILAAFAETLSGPLPLEWPLDLRGRDDWPWRRFFAGADPGRTYVVFTDSRGPEKTWPHFFALMQALLAQEPQSRVAWCAGTPAQPPFAAPADRFLNLTGCPLDEMIDLVRQPSVFVGNDTGPMHLAAASGNRVLAIFGPTSPERFGPYPLHSPRHRAVIAPGGQLAALTPETVLAAVQELSVRPKRDERRL